MSAEIVSLVTRLLRTRGIRATLELEFKNFDFAKNGQVSKEDFTNTVFESAKEVLKPAQTLKIVNHFARNSESVNYQWFL